MASHEQGSPANADTHDKCEAHLWFLPSLHQIGCPLFPPTWHLLRPIVCHLICMVGDTSMPLQNLSLLGAFVSFCWWSFVHQDITNKLCAQSSLVPRSCPYTTYAHRVALFPGPAQHFSFACRESLGTRLHTEHEA